ncbi:MAG: winged helix-turn-helix domain-containing protein [Candidatus Sulfotelmatobacter sp.]
MDKAVQHLYEFGPFVLDPGERLLRHGTTRMELPPRAFDTLLVLVENSGRLLEKDALMRNIWRDTVVEENNLSQVVYLVRKALGDGEDGARYIETVPKRGYRFVGEVRKFNVDPGNGNGHTGSNDRDLRSSSSSGNQPGTSSSDYSEFSRPPVATVTRAGSEAESHPVSSEDAKELGAPASHSAARHGWMTGLLGGLSIVALVVLVEGTGWKQRLFEGQRLVSIRSVAVLPMQNLSNDPGQEYFVDGMTDELITDLAQLHDLKVVSKTSVMPYKGTRKPLPQIGRELGVDAVVEGSVLRSGDRVRITAQLIRTATDRHIWAEAYDGDLKDVLSLQARVAEEITNQVKLNLSSEETGRLRRPRAVNPEAYDLYLHGRYAWNQRNVQAFRQAIEYFNQALEKDSEFALAYSGLADCHTLLTLYGDGVGNMVEAEAAAEKALQIDSSLAEAHTSLAAVKVLHDWDWRGAEQEFRRAIALNPNFARAHHWYGNLLLGPEGRHEEAIAELERARELDPLSLIINADAGFGYYLAGRYEPALQAYRSVLAVNPNFVPVRFYLAKYYRQTGQYDLWLKESVEDDRLSGSPGRGQSLQRLYAQGGFRAAMQDMAKPPEVGSLARPKPFRIDSCSSAEANAALGKNAAALNALEDCYRWSEPALIYLKVDPVWTNLRPEPRFQALLGRLHLQ